MKNNQTIQTIIIVISVIALILLEPTLIFIIGYFSGLLLSWIFGSIITESLNMIFSTNRFTVEILPWLIATIATFASFFKNNNIGSSDK